ASTARCTTLSTADASRASARSASARPPAAVTSAVSRSSAAGSTSTPTTVPPSRATIIAVARPMPAPAAAISATFPWDLMSPGAVSWSGDHSAAGAALGHPLQVDGQGAAGSRVDGQAVQPVAASLQDEVPPVLEDHGGAVHADGPAHLRGAGAGGARDLTRGPGARVR